ncbi:hypothetical protein [Pseudomonas matsuisoli]|uniref:Uncharacterized protein n=1 Tax=Pseudomonas matsuisoli TaxID=1515666 RepID=A0A917UZB3_9PSED|nr:hypothetical protein [Pseudomonas matsuisoli]GGK02484.1 hypothetical protein GCM10009304_30360 [Pseudomonas matsuisoli]
MTKGAKPGQNRFAGAQQRQQEFRANRIKEDVIPRLNAVAGKASFDGPTPFSRFCAELYNDGLPVNEKKIGYRTIVQSTEYWGLLKPIYYKHWGPSSDTEAKKDKMIAKLAVQRADLLQAELEKVKKDNDALRSALRSHGASPTPQPVIKEIDPGYMAKFDKTCRSLKLVLDASDGMFAVDIESKKISCTFNDLEPSEGLVPTELIEPFVLWIKRRQTSDL